MKRFFLAFGLLIGLSGATLAQGCGPSNPNCIVPTAPNGTSNNQAASTAFVQSAVAGVGAAITAITGDLTAAGPGSVVGTLATVNANVGTFGSSTSIPNLTVNGKGLVTAAGGNAVIAPAGTLSGTTLNSTVVNSSLTSGAGGAFGTFAYQNFTTPPAIGGGTPAAGNFTTLGASGVGTFGASLKVQVRTFTTTGAATLSATTDYFLCVNKASGAATTVNLPASPATGLTYLIKDCKGDAATNNITITPNAGSIDNAGTYVINTNLGSVAVTYNGTGWFVN